MAFSFPSGTSTTGETELRNKRNVRMLPKALELADIHKQASVRCILDGELICLVNGESSFETIQRRSLMSNQYKIKLETQKNSASFIAFDCLYFDGQDLTMRRSDKDWMSYFQGSDIPK